MWGITGRKRMDRPMDFDETLTRLTERMETLQERNQLLERRLDGIRRMAQTLAGTIKLEEILSRMVEVVTSTLDAERATVFLVDEGNGDLVSGALIASEISAIRLKPGQGIAGWVAESGKVLNIKDAYRDKRFDPSTDKRTGFLTRSILCVPMKTYWGQIVGVIQVLNKRDGYFTLEDSDILATISTQASISIENSKNFNALQAANSSLREAEEGVRRNYTLLETLYSIQTQMTQAFERNDLLDAVLSGLQNAMPCGVACAWMFLPGGGAVRMLRHGELDVVEASAGNTRLGLLGVVQETGASVLQLEPLPGSDSRMLHPDLPVQAISYVVEPVLREDGRLAGALAVINRWGYDLFAPQDAQIVRIVARQLGTALDRLTQHQELLKSANMALIGQAVSGVLHDIKSPLNLVSGFAQLMEGEEDASKRAEYATDIVRQAQFIKSMTQEVLAFAKGERQTFKRPIFLQTFLADVEALLNQEFSGRGIEVSLRNEFKGKIKADEDKLKRLIFNLARNARDAMPNGGRFSIEVTEDDANLRWSISDTGHGIPPEVQAQMFQSFVTKGKKDGTGLGLAIVKSIVDQHGGSISFETAPGVGTTFVILLPKE